jgi:heme exporter protein D
MTLGPNAGFIIAAYTAALVIVSALIGWVIHDYRRQTRILAELEAQGVTRRSERASEGRP